MSDATYVSLIKGHPFIAGHLFKDVIPNKVYKVIDTYGSSKAIHDETGKVIWITGTAFKGHFKDVQIPTNLF